MVECLLLCMDIPLRLKLFEFHEDSNVISMIGTIDWPCWLAQACKPWLVLI